MATTLAGSTVVAHDRAALEAEEAYRDLEDLPTTAAGVEQIDQIAVELAAQLGAVPISADAPDTPCPEERLRVSWDRPEGYAHGAYIEPVAPRRPRR